MTFEIWPNHLQQPFWKSSWLQEPITSAKPIALTHYRNTKTNPLRQKNPLSVLLFLRWSCRLHRSWRGGLQAKLEIVAAENSTQMLSVSESFALVFPNRVWPLLFSRCLKNSYLPGFQQEQRILKQKWTWWYYAYTSWQAWQAKIK